MSDEPIQPRKFGKPRVFELDGGFTVTIKGSEDSFEQECYPVFEANELHVYTGDAAIEMRAAKQLRGASIPTPTAQNVLPFEAVQTSAPAGPAMPGKEPQFLGDRTGGYTGIGPRPIDSEQAAFDALGLSGINVNEIKSSLPGGARLAAAPEEIVAP